MADTLQFRGLQAGLFTVCILIGACSNEHNEQITEHVNLEFELTYRYVSKNLPINISYQNDFDTFKSMNRDAFTTIAYTWHSMSMKECELVNTQSATQKSGYERMINDLDVDNYLLTNISNQDRPCLAQVFFDNWKSINTMLSHSFKNKI